MSDEKYEFEFRLDLTLEEIRQSEEDMMKDKCWSIEQLNYLREIMKRLKDMAIKDMAKENKEKK